VFQLLKFNEILGQLENSPLSAEPDHGKPGPGIENDQLRRSSLKKIGTGGGIVRSRRGIKLGKFVGHTYLG